MRSPGGVNENTLHQRLGTQAPGFFRDILPVLLKHGVLVGVQFRGPGLRGDSLSDERWPG
jgi:hypothetical protein